MTGLPKGLMGDVRDIYLQGFADGADAERRRFRPLARRNRALENLLVCYRLSKRPSEKLFRELDGTKTDAEALIADLLGGDQS